MSYYRKTGNYIHNIAQEQADRKYRLIDSVAYEDGLLRGVELITNSIAKILTIEKVI